MLFIGNLGQAGEIPWSPRLFRQRRLNFNRRINLELPRNQERKSIFPYAKFTKVHSAAWYVPHIRQSPDIFV